MKRSYKQITCWENDERIKYLKDFHSHVVNYFNNIGHNNVGDSWEEKPAEKERKEINKLIDKAHSYIIDTGISTDIIVNGILIDLVLNIFNLMDMHISYDHLLDSIERAIARYENDRKRAIFRTYNPLFWIALFIDWVVSLPFEFLGKFSLQQDKFEASISGRLLKFLFFFAHLRRSFS